MGKMKKQSYLERSFISFLGFSSCIIILAKGIVAAGLKNMEIFVVGFPEQLIIDMNSLSEIRWIGYLYSPIWK